MTVKYDSQHNSQTPHLHHPRWLIYSHIGVCPGPVGRPPARILPPLPQHSRLSSDHSGAAAAIAVTLLLPAAIAAAACIGASRSSP